MGPNWKFDVDPRKIQQVFRATPMELKLTSTNRRRRPLKSISMCGGYFPVGCS